MLSLSLPTAPSLPHSMPLACKNKPLGPKKWNPTSNIVAFPKRSFKGASSPSDSTEYRHENEGKKDLVDLDQVLAMCEGLQGELIPKHVALFMDGHRRWAKERHLPVELGYGAGRRPLKEIAGVCCALGIKVLSVFAFSNGNFRRPKEEVDFAMNIIESAMKSDLEEIARNDIRVSIIGNRSVIPKPLQEIIAHAEEMTKDNKRLHILGAVDYTGRSDIIQACMTLAERVKDGLIEPGDIDEKLFEQELLTKCCEYPNPDLFIRTSGRYRLGNFMLWQLAYSELYFVEKYAPDFKAPDFIQALLAYQKRHRRFGGHKYETKAPSISQE